MRWQDMARHEVVLPPEPIAMDFKMLFQPAIDCLVVVLELPEDESRWMTVSSEELVLRRRAYWLNLQRGFDEIAGKQTVTVQIPEQNLFNVESLCELMERSRIGDI